MPTIYPSLCSVTFTDNTELPTYAPSYRLPAYNIWTNILNELIKGGFNRTNKLKIASKLLFSDYPEKNPSYMCYEKNMIIGGGERDCVLFYENETSENYMFAIYTYKTSTPYYNYYAIFVNPDAQSQVPTSIEISGETFFSLMVRTIKYNLENVTLSNTIEYVFLGLSYNAGITIPTTNPATIISQIKILMDGKNVTSDVYSSTGQSINITNITGNVYITVKATNSLMTINLYRNYAENNRVDKTDYLGDVGSITGALKEMTSLTTPSILIERNDIDFNYVYIEKLGYRYYFVEEVTSVRHNLWLVKLKVDVLMTYKSEIKTQKGYISRNENDYDEFLIDNQIPMENEPLIDMVDTTTIFSTSDVDTLLINYYR